MRFISTYIRMCAALVCLGSLAMPACGAGIDDPTTVNLIQQHVPAKGMMMMEDENGAQRIFALSLPNNRAALTILPQLGKLDRLTSLFIAYDGLTDKDVAKLPRLPRLLELRMSKNHVTDKGLKSLGGATELRQLRLRRTQIRGPGLAYLKDSKKLEWLDLSGSPLDDSAIPHIVKYFKHLRRFDFDDTNVTADGLLQLAELPWLIVIGPPDNIVSSRKDPNYKQRKRELITKYVAAYKEAKRKAREAGEDVPPDHVAPFGGAD